MKKWNFKSVKKNDVIVSKIAARANAMLIESEKQPFSMATIMMDLHCVNHHMKLDFERWFAADDFNFMHDIVGINKHLNRKTQELENCFLPRFKIQKKSVFNHG